MLSDGKPGGLRILSLATPNRHLPYGSIRVAISGSFTGKRVAAHTTMWIPSTMASATAMEKIASLRIVMVGYRQPSCQADALTRRTTVAPFTITVKATVKAIVASVHPRRGR